jgi:hypothetical protein
MPRKNALIPYQIVSSGNMASNVTSKVTNIQFLDNISVQANFTGTPTGTLNVQGSVDYSQDAQGNVINAGNWITITTNSPSGSANQVLFDLNQLSFPYLRLQYVASSGSGTLNAYVSGKEV